MEAVKRVDELDIVTLPVGVKLREFQSDQSPNTHPEVQKFFPLLNSKMTLFVSY